MRSARPAVMPRFTIKRGMAAPHHQLVEHDDEGAEDQGSQHKSAAGSHFIQRLMFGRRRSVVGGRALHQILGKRNFECEKSLALKASDAWVAVWVA